MSDLVEITESNFNDEVIKSDLPVLIDFWAVWCGPCKMVAPVVEDLAKEYQGRIKVGKCDVDSNQQIAISYGIRSIPTLLIFKNGQVAKQIVGAVPKQHVAAQLNEVLES